VAFIPIPNSATLCFDFTSAGQNWQFCLTVRKSAGAITSTDLASIATIGGAWWTSDLRAEITTTTTLRQVRVTDMQVEGGQQEIDTFNQAGTGGGGITPLNSPIVVSLRTAKRGRSYRGRAYVSGIPQDALLNPVDYTVTRTASVAAAFIALQADLDVAGYDLVVASKKHNGVVTNPAETNEVIAILVDQHVDSQRRRLFGRGT